MGKVLAIGSETCYNPGMETNPLQMVSVDMIHEAVVTAYDAEADLYRMRKWVRRAGIGPEHIQQGLCGRLEAAQDIILAVRKELDRLKAIIETQKP